MHRKRADVVRSLPQVTTEQARLIYRLGELYEPDAPERRMFHHDIDSMRSLPPLTEEQWQLIYDTEKYFADTTVPLPQEQRSLYCDVSEHIRNGKGSLLSARTKVIIAAYLLGCLLIYSGIAHGIVGIGETGTLRFQPETDIFTSLLEAAVMLLRPLLAVMLISMVIMWGFVIPVVAIVSGVAGVRRWITMFLGWFRD